jgi:hypothetical protein
MTKQELIDAVQPTPARHSNQSPRKRNRSLDAPAPKFRILKNHRGETRAGNLGLQRETPVFLARDRTFGG